MTSIRDHRFHLDWPGQPMSWKEQVLLMFCIISVYCPCPCSSTTQRNIGYYSSSGPLGRIVSNGACPVCFPLIVCSPIERRVEADYTFTNIVSLGCPRCWLYEVEIFLQVEVCDRCSDVWKRFSVIGNDGGNIMYKKSYDQSKKTQNSIIGHEPVKWRKATNKAAWDYF